MVVSLTLVLRLLKVVLHKRTVRTHDVLYCELAVVVLPTTEVEEADSRLEGEFKTTLQADGVTQCLAA